MNSFNSNKKKKIEKKQQQKSGSYQKLKSREIGIHSFITLKNANLPICRKVPNYLRIFIYFFNVFPHKLRYNHSTFVEHLEYDEE